jgi:protein SCO1/2
VPLGDGDYTMDHTATVYLMDAQGNFSGTISWGEDPGSALAKVRKLAANG